jgi:zinc protease
LTRRLENTSVELSPSVSDDAIELSGGSAPRDLELMFQVLYAYIAQPRADTAVFHRYRDRMTAYARSRDVDPDKLFDDSVSATISQHHRRAVQDDASAIASLRLESALGFWRDRMRNASNFTVVMTGDFTLERVRPLVERYLASLPAGARESARDMHVRFPMGILRRSFVAGIGPKARTQIVWTGPFDAKLGTDDNIGAAADIAERAVSEHLRERLGGTYGVSVSPGYVLVPPFRYTLTLDFEAAPERIDSLSRVALEELERLRTRGPTAAEIQRVREARVRDLDGQLERNTFWANELRWYARVGWPLAAIADEPTRAKLVSDGEIREACKRYLDASQFVQVTMYPRRNR